MRVIVIGAGGHAKVVWDTLIALGHVVVGFQDDNPRVDTLLGAPVRARLADLPDADGALVAIGNNAVRQARFEALTLSPVTAIHPQAIVSPHATIGRGTLVMPGVVINIHATIGDNVIINTGARIDHDCVVGDHAHIGPGSILAGAVTVEAGAFVGAGTTIIPGRRIGAGATTGAGSVVLEDVPALAVVVGVPARPIKKAPGNAEGPI